MIDKIHSPNKISVSIRNDNGRLDAAVIITFLAALPFVFSFQIYDPVQIPQTFAGFLFCFIICVLLFYKYSKDNLTFGFVDLFWLGYTIFTIISLIFTRDLSVGIFETGKVFLEYLLFKVFQFVFLKKHKLFDYIGIVVSLGCIIQCSLALGQMYFGIKLYGAESGFLGTMTHANIFSECILFSLPFVFIGLFNSKQSFRLISLTALILCSVLLVAAKTRSAWVGSVISIIAVTFFLYKNSIPESLKSSLLQWRRPLFLSGTVFLLMLSLIIITDHNNIYSHLISLFTLNSSGRVEIWTKTIPIIKDHFLFGVGPGNWRFYIPIINNMTFQRPHNDYLWVFSESGIFAFLSYIGIFTLALYTIINNFEKLKGKDLLVNYCMLYGCIAFLCDSFFAFPKERPYLLVLIALIQSVVFSIQPVKAIAKIRVSYFAIAAIFVSGIFLYFCWNRYEGEKTVKIAMQDLRLDSATKLNMIRQINPVFYTADPFSTPVKNFEGTLWIDMGDFEQAKKSFLEAYRIVPLNPSLLINLGSLSEITSNRPDAKKYYNEAIAFDTSNPQALLNLAVVEYKDRNLTRAADLVKRVNPKSISNQRNLQTQYSILKPSLGLN